MYFHSKSLSPLECVITSLFMQAQDWGTTAMQNKAFPGMEPPPSLTTVPFQKPLVNTLTFHKPPSRRKKPCCPPSSQNTVDIATVKEVQAAALALCPAEGGHLFHKCLYCLKSYPSMEGLAIHLTDQNKAGDNSSANQVPQSSGEGCRVQKGHKYHECQHCAKIFQSSGVLECQTNNNSDKPFVCKFCSKVFPVPSNLTNHLKKHIGIKPYVCQYCTKAFSRAVDLKSHTRIHTGERAHVCNYCLKAFSRSDNLIIHARIHTQENLFVCKYCSKAFTRADNLRRHHRIHTGEKPHVCQYCSKAFNQVSHLNTHVSIHTGEKPHVCQYCPKSFSRSAYLRNHLKVHIGEKSIPADPVQPSHST